MRSSTVFLIIATLFLLVVVDFAWGQCDANNHTPRWGCNCQCGGENGGHCHCPWEIQVGHCRNGGNHWICFPFGNEPSCVGAGVCRPANPMM